MPPYISGCLSLNSLQACSTSERTTYEHKEHKELTTQIHCCLNFHSIKALSTECPRQLPRKLLMSKPSFYSCNCSTILSDFQELYLVFKSLQSMYNTISLAQLRNKTTFWLCFFEFYCHMIIIVHISGV